jgi:hypothetical protein
MRRRLTLVALTASVAALAPPARAAEPEPVGGLAELKPKDWTTVALFLGGVATSFIAHESCHVAANYVLGSHPHFEGVTYLGFIPFFAISPSVKCRGYDCYQDDGSVYRGGPTALYAIVAAGVQCQQVGNEIILSTEPRLRYREAPFRKGMLAMNVALSIGYAFSNWAKVEPPQGDIATNDRLLTKVPQGALAAAIFVPAVLDLLRYLWPDSPWVPWVARLSKGALLGFAFAI